MTLSRVAPGWRALLLRSLSPEIAAFAKQVLEAAFTLGLLLGLAVPAKAGLQPSEVWSRLIEIDIVIHWAKAHIEKDGEPFRQNP